MGFRDIVDKCWTYENSKRTNIDGQRIYALASIRTRVNLPVAANAVIYVYRARRSLYAIRIDARDSYRWPFSYHVERLVYEHFARS